MLLIQRNKRKEGSTNEKRCIQSHSNEIKTIEPIFKSEIRKGGDRMSTALSGRGKKKVRDVQTKKDIQSCTNEIQTIKSIFES